MSADEDEDENEKILRKLRFSDIDVKKVEKLVENLYDGLKLRRIHYLIKILKSSRNTKQALFLKEEIDKDYYNYIYFYNEFAKEMCRLYCGDSANEENVGKTESDHKNVQDKKKYRENLHLKSAINPIEGILDENVFFKKLNKLENDVDAKPLTFDQKISLFNKYNKISFMKMKIRYFKMSEDIKSTCEKIIEIGGEKAKDPKIFPYYIRYIINSIHIAETRALESIVEKKQLPKDEMGFLKPIFDVFDKFSNMGKDITVTIKKPLQIEGYPPAQAVGGKKIYVKNIMPRKVVVCRHKSVKKCKRASVSCKYVSGKTRKYCRRSTKKSIANYYAAKKN